MSESYYEVLGVPNTASPEEIKSAYRNLAMIVHPDQGGPAELFERVGAAYEVLANRARRNSYDLFLARGGVDPSAYRRSERQWRERAERQRSEGHTSPHSTGPHSPGPRKDRPGGTAQRDKDPGAKPPHTDRPPEATEPVPPRSTTNEQARRARTTKLAAPGDRANYIRYMVGGAAFSFIGFWVVQILGLAIEGDLDNPSDVLDLNRSSWWIVALAAANVVLAYRTHSRRSSANLVVATIICSALLLLVFLGHGAGSDDLGVWPAAAGAVVSVVSAWLYLRNPSGPGST